MPSAGVPSRLCCCVVSWAITARYFREGCAGEKDGLLRQQLSNFGGSGIKGLGMGLGMGVVMGMYVCVFVCLFCALFGCVLLCLVLFWLVFLLWLVFCFVVCFGLIVLFVFVVFLKCVEFV